MRIKILMRFAKKVLVAVLVITGLISFGMAIILLSQWIARMLPSDSAAWISLGVVAAIGGALWIVDQYKESVKEVKREQRQSVAPNPPDKPPDWHFTIGGIVE